MSRYPANVRVVEVGPRDGLQNEQVAIPTGVKVAFIERLVAAGCSEIEAGSFVHPERVPQLADAEAVFAALGPRTDTRLSALVPNERGLDRALAAGVRRIALFTAASESFVTRNIGMTVDESLAVFQAVAKRALAAGLTMRGYVSTAFACPYEGEIGIERVAAVTGALFDLGVDEVSLGDTIGVAVPLEVRQRLERLGERFSRERLALHFHDTSGTALANVVAALELGFATFDASAGGLGGCPFAPGASGNLATEDLVYLFDRTGIATGISLEGVAEASSLLEAHLGHPLPGRLYRRLRSHRDQGGSEAPQ